jgi:hypothetical protein
MDWQMVSFTGLSLLKEYWVYYGLPRMYYWEMKKQAHDSIAVSASNVNSKVA